MKLGTEDKKKVGVLAALGLAAAYFLYTNVLSDSSTSPEAPKPAVVSERAAEATSAAASMAAPPPTSEPATSPRRLGGTGRSRSDEFHPSLHPKRKEDQPDLPSIDPTLRLDLLAKVQNVKLDGGQRNLFQFGTMVAVVQPKGPEPIVKPIRPPMDYPRPYDTGPIIVKRDPVAPPFTPKYYGLATKRIDGKKTAFFLDGEDILLATEGMTVKSRFKLIRIDADSVVVQHLDFKSQQTVKISEDAGGTL